MRSVAAGGRGGSCAWYKRQAWARPFTGSDVDNVAQKIAMSSLYNSVQNDTLFETQQDPENAQLISPGSGLTNIYSLHIERKVVELL